MAVVRLTTKQKQCNHSWLGVRASSEFYYRHGRHRKAEIFCPDCQLVVARAGEIYFNRREVVDGILQEHWSALLSKRAITTSPKYGHCLTCSQRKGLRCKLRGLLTPIVGNDVEGLSLYGCPSWK